MKRQIHVLAPEVISQIAAGEVVERPASVMKELVENALDAQSTEIRVRASGGGISMIEVADNGLGMDRAGAQEALKRYATSKIQNMDDLMSLASLGFRGEALFSIAAVSRLELVTRTQEHQEGTCIRIDGGNIVNVSACGAPPGTRIRVEELFYNLPARRKFLRTPKTEAHCMKVTLDRLSMVSWKVGFYYAHEDRRVLHCPPSTRWTERVRQLWGKDLFENLYPVHNEGGDVLVEGILSHPNFHRSSASLCWLYVNDRAIQDRGLLHAVIRGYGSLLERGRYPVGVLRITLDPSEIDVNVHPTKREIRFREPQRVQSAVVATVRHFLMEQPWVPNVLVSGVPDGMLHQEYPLVGEGIAEPSPVPAFSSKSSDLLGHKQPLFTSGKGEHSELWEIRYMGQLAGTYLIFSSPNGLLLLDQHAAHERILFEKIKAQLLSDKRGPVQTMLWDEMVELTPIQSETLERLRETLLRLGWEIEPFGGESWRIRTLPRWMEPSGSLGLLKEILEECAEENGKGSWESLIERVLARMACHGAVKGRRFMGEREAIMLLQLVRQSTAKGLCPHGRPTYVNIPLSELKRRFGRT
jgi:DNA mismatch repair protein MutL